MIRGNPLVEKVNMTRSHPKLAIENMRDNITKSEIICFDSTCPFGACILVRLYVFTCS